MKFTSKRNDVTGDGEIVTKRFLREEDYIRELNMVQHLNGSSVRIPRLISHSDCTLVYEMVQGTLYANLAENMRDVHAKEIAHWLRAYHEVSGVLRVDVNLRNFIFSHDGKCYGIDFESECAAGDTNEDFGKILAFCATYDPIFSEGKSKSCAHLLAEFINVGAVKNAVIKYYYAEILQIISRRGSVDISYDAAKFFINNLLGDTL